jgi:hypothetical protein
VPLSTLEPEPQIVFFFQFNSTLSPYKQMVVPPKGTYKNPDPYFGSTFTWADGTDASYIAAQTSNMQFLPGKSTFIAFFAEASDMNLPPSVISPGESHNCR